MAEVAAGIKPGSGKQPVAVLERDKLTSVKMPGKHQIERLPRDRSPDPRIVGTQDANITRCVLAGVRSADGDRSGAKADRHASIVDPLRAALNDGVPDQWQPDSGIVISANGQYGRESPQFGNKHGQLRQLGSSIEQITAQQNQIRSRCFRRLQDLFAKHAGSPRSQMNVADVEDATNMLVRARVRRMQELPPHIQRFDEPDFQRSAHQWLARQR